MTRRIFIAVVLTIVLDCPLTAAGAIEMTDSGQVLGDGRTFSTALADLDNDGDLDLFVTQYTTDCRIWFNDGTGIFSDSGQGLGPASGHGVALGDIDGDGDVDAFVVYNSAPDRVYLNGGTGVFSDTGQALGPATDAGLFPALGDIDGDGDLDALVSLYQQSNRIWLNNGTGVFADSGASIGDASSGGMAPGDLDGDGDLDVVLTVSAAPDRVLINDGAGILTDSGQNVGTTISSGHAALGDLDGDLDLDLFKTNREEGSRVFLNDGAGTFSDTGQLLGSRGQKLDIADLDGDGDRDVVVTHMADGCAVWVNDGAGSFATDGATFGGTDILSITTGDIDDDDRTDAILGKLEGTGGNRVYLNRTDAPVTSVGYLWLSGYDWSGDPTPIYRYDLVGGVIDRVVDTGLADQMVNNLAVRGDTLFVGAGHGPEFWRANAATGEILLHGTYSPETPGLFMDGACRPSDGHLLRADALGRVLESDTDGVVLAVHDVSGGAGLTGLEAVGDVVYGTCDAGFGEILTGAIWSFEPMSLAGLETGVGVFLGGLAHAVADDTLYLSVYRNETAWLYRVAPAEGTATLVVALPDAGFPSGAWPQAMGWFDGATVAAEKTDWGGLKALYR